MYAVIKTGGKQYRVAEGDRLSVELLGAPETDVAFAPLLVVDGADTLTGSALAEASVAGRIVGATKGPKIVGFTYRPKSRGRKSWGHRQHYSLVEITSITTSATPTAAAEPAAAPASASASADDTAPVEDDAPVKDDAVTDVATAEVTEAPAVADVAPDQATPVDEPVTEFQTEESNDV